MGLTLRLEELVASRVTNVFEFIRHSSVKPLCILNKWAGLFSGGD
jgi:hypothetical protein